MINKNEFNFIKFRSELIDLLNKYDYSISGTTHDDGSMEIEDNKSSNSYIMRNEYSEYELLNSDWEEVSSDYILNMFDMENTTIKPSKTRVGVFTKDYTKAERTIYNIYKENKENIKYYTKNREFINLRLNDETDYIWIKPTMSSRGYRCSKVYIDKNLTLDELNTIVLPVCIFCTREDVKII